MPAFAGMTVIPIAISALAHKYSYSIVMPAKAGIQGYWVSSMKDYYVYMMASKRNGTLYTGITSDLVRRVYEHRTGAVEGFTKRYGVKMLVWYETTQDVNSAIAREKNIQAWKRQWKLELIEKTNLQWNDLWPEVSGCQLSLA